MESITEDNESNENGSRSSLVRVVWEAILIDGALIFALAPVDA